MPAAFNDRADLREGQQLEDENQQEPRRDVEPPDLESAEKLIAELYDELRELAHHRLRRCPPGMTLQPTALVNEAYLRLVDKGDPRWEGRRHFFGAAAQAMRNILVDAARNKGAIKRGGDRKREQLEYAQSRIVAPTQGHEDQVAINDALERLESEDPRKREIINLRFYCGLTAAETAKVLGVSLTTVEREWRYIKAWLFKELGGLKPDQEVGS